MSRKTNPLSSIFAYISDKFDLSEDKALQSDVVEGISKSAEFRGTNLWVLIFATFIASLGLNVNSAAVIIGAMLISPLMGPIMGLGVSLGINDFELMKRSVRNFGFMVAVSILTSTLYFILSPISTAQSELLARTSPTTYDVLIALFGGLAGMVAQSRRDKGVSTVIPGVAIATALMPPLCTAGFGIATLQWKYFVGAAYLFSINTIFIAAGAYAITRIMKYDKKVFLDKQRETRVKRYMAIIMIATLIPSVFVSYRIIQQTVFETNADRFVTSVFRFPDSKVIQYRKTPPKRGNPGTIEVAMIGDPLSRDAVEGARAQMPGYGLVNTELVVNQAAEKDIDLSTLNVNYAQLLEEKNEAIAALRSELEGFQQDNLPYADIAAEAAQVVDNIAAITLSRATRHTGKGEAKQTVVLCVVEPKSPGGEVDIQKLSDWLKVRTKSEEVIVHVK